MPAIPFPWPCVTPTPASRAGIDDLLAKDPNIDRIIAVPHLPYMALTQTVVEKTQAVQQMHFPNIAIDFVDPFYKDQRYIDQALAGSIQDHSSTDKHDYLLFSYHGVPVRHLKEKLTPPKKHCFTN